MNKDNVIEKLRDDEHYYGDFGKKYLSNSDISALLTNPLALGKPSEPRPAFLVGGYFHMLALGYEYTKRYGKVHASIIKCEKFLNVPPVHIPDGDFCEPPQAMPDKYKVPGCSITAYWNYYGGEKYTVANKDEMLITRNDL